MRASWPTPATMPSTWPPPCGRTAFRFSTGSISTRRRSSGRIRDFAAALVGADVGVFFYAGHGLQISGANYLVPIDAQLRSASALDFEMVRFRSCSGQWSARRPPTSCSLTPAATTRSRPTSRGPWAHVRRISGAVWHRLSPGSAPSSASPPSPATWRSTGPRETPRLRAR